jgi:hypothetical protein
MAETSWRNVRLRVMTRLFAKPAAGHLAYGLCRWQGKKMAFLCFWERPSRFFFPQHLQPRRVSVLRGSLQRAGRGTPRVVTSQRGGERHDAADVAPTTAAGHSASSEGQLAEREVAYLAGFGFEQHWEGAARGYTVVGLSDTHARGLFAARDIPKGTLVICQRNIAFLDGPASVMFASWFPQRMSAVAQYMHQTAGAMQLPLSPAAHHIINHSCTPNLRCGFTFAEGAPLADRAAAAGALGENEDGNASPVRYASMTRAEAAAATAAAAVVRTDYNCFVASRDIPSGEELSTDYAKRVVPFFPKQLAAEYSPATCNCRSPQCRGELYPNAGDLSFYLSDAQRSREVPRLLTQRSKLLPPLTQIDETAAKDGDLAAAAEEDVGDDNKNHTLDWHDDELVRLAFLRNRGPLIREVQGKLRRRVMPYLDVVNGIDTTLAYLNFISVPRTFRQENDGSIALKELPRLGNRLSRLHLATPAPSLSDPNPATPELPTRVTAKKLRQ